LKLVEEQPVHCEDCSSECDSHEGSECPTLYSLHLALKIALANAAKLAPTHVGGSGCER